jgi:hypothetical protein
MIFLLLLVLVVAQKMGVIEITVGAGEKKDVSALHIFLL